MTCGRAGALPGVTRAGAGLLLLAALLAQWPSSGVADAPAAASRSTPNSAAAGAAPAPATAGSATVTAGATAAAGGTPLTGVERTLLGALEALAEGQLEQARTRIAALTQRLPDYALARALKADLAPPAAPDAARLARKWLEPQAPPCPDDLAGLCAEARTRWAHREFRPPETLPFVWHLAPRVRHLIVVETQTSRLYLFRHEGGRLILRRDLYASIGHAGAGKTREGDGRTPLGVYFTISRMDDSVLDDRYGAHAFPLDYPNAWDRRLGRTGRGIWLHGVPPVTYARPPQASDGCVALANEDIGWLAARVAPRHTPVVTLSRLPAGGEGSGGDGGRRPGGADPAAQALLLARVQAWWAALRAEGGQETWRKHARGFYEAPLAVDLPATAPSGRGTLRVVAALRDPNQPDLVVVASEDEAGRWYRQHWRADGTGQWRIAAERNPTAPRHRTASAAVR